MSFIDDIAPRYYGEGRLRLTLAERTPLLIAFRPVLINVDYQDALPEGIVLPLEFTVSAPTGVNNERHVYRRFAPSQLTFTPREGGSFLVRLAEQWHNRWWGGITLEISGDRISAA